MSLFNRRELEWLENENQELRDKNCELTRKICALEVKLFEVYGEESLNNLVDELELSSAQRSKLGLLFSIERCRLVGVPEDKIIHNIEELDKYFTIGES